MIWKFFTFIAAGFVGSFILYPRTHVITPESSQLPETLGIVVGGLLVVGAYVAYEPKDDDGFWRLIAAFSSVAIGMGLNRVRMAVKL